MFRRFVIVAAALVAWPAAANPFSDGWSCAKNAGLSATSVGAETFKKGEALAKAAGPLGECLARTGTEGQALAATSSAITALKLAKPSLLPKGQCASRIKGTATKPFGYAIAALAPAGGAKDKLLAALSSEEATKLVWSQIGQMPIPISMVPDQIDCGCVIAETGTSLADISQVSEQIAKTSQSCAKFLDEVGLGVINDIGGAAVKYAKTIGSAASGKYDEWVSGQTDPAAPGAVYQGYFGQHVNTWASLIANGNAAWQTAKLNHNTSECSAQGNYSDCQKSIGDLFNECVAYYDDHKMSKGNAKKVCTSFRDTAVDAASRQAKKWIALAKLPKFLDQKKYDWSNNDWAWRLPVFWEPASFKNGVLTPINWVSAGNQLVKDWSDVWGGISKWKEPWNYDASGIYGAAKALTPELGNDHVRAADLAYAGAFEPLRDKVRTTWLKYRKENGKYQLAQWYPKEAFGELYGCPNSLSQACTAAMEKQYDKTCIPRMIAHYTTAEKAVKKIPMRLMNLSKECRAELDPIKANALTLDGAEQVVIGTALAACKQRQTREAITACSEKAIAIYRGCAVTALEAGQNDASACFAKNWGKNKLILDGPPPGLAPQPSVPPTQMPGTQTMPPAQPAMPDALPSPPTARAVQKSTLCRFTAGPRRGETQDYAPMAPIPVGSNCHDARGSTGTVVAQ